MRIVWTARAKEKLQNILDHIADDDPQAALWVVDRIEDRVGGLCDFPHTGRIGRVDKTRELVIPGLPYIVVYTVSKELVDIVTVRHTSQEWPESFEEKKRQ